MLSIYPCLHELNKNSNGIHISIVVFFETRIPRDAKVLIPIVESFNLETPVILIAFIVLFRSLLVVEVHVIGEEHVHTVFQVIEKSLLLLLY